MRTRVTFLLNYQVNGISFLHHKHAPRPHPEADDGLVPASGEGDGGQGGDLVRLLGVLHAVLGELLPPPLPGQPDGVGARAGFDCAVGVVSVTILRKHSKKSKKSASHLPAHWPEGGR